MWLRYGVYDIETGTLHVVHDAGLFSCLSVTLWTVAELVARGHVPRRVDLDHTLLAYRDSRGTDMHAELFEPVDPTRLEQITAQPKSRFARFDHHGDYRDLDLVSLTLLRETYLRFNESVTRRRAELCNESLAPDLRYLGVSIRGTDKAEEVFPVDSSVYLETARGFLDAGRVDRVFVQTDQAQVRSLFLRELAGRCDVVERLPVTEGGVAIHDLEAIDGRRVDFARDMLAAVSILAEMPFVLTHTGNIAAWTVLLRGSVDGVYQAQAGRLVPLG